MGSNSHSSQNVESEYSESPLSLSSNRLVLGSVPLTVTSLYSVSNVVPDQEKHEFEQTMSSFEGI